MAAAAAWRAGEVAVPPRSYYGEVGRRLARDWAAMTALGTLLALTLAALAAPALAGADPLLGSVAQRLLPLGSPGHPLGTDEQGRDVLTRLLYGGRLSLLVGVVPVMIATAVGTLVGTVAGYAQGALGALLMRAMDVSYAFPAILLAIAVAASLGAGVSSSIIALSVVFIPPVSRVAESATRQVVVQEYVEAARLSGAGTLQVLLPQVLPNVFSPIFVYASSLVGLSIIIASGLSFLGLGAAPPAAEWGAMLNGLRASIYVRPSVVALPGLLIFVTSMAFNVLSSGLRDALDVRSG